MNKQATPKKSRKKVWIKLGVFLAIIFFAAALLVIRVSLDHLNEIYKNREQQAMELEEGNQDLQNYIDNSGTDEGVKDVATGELGMVDPDTVIYDFD